MKLNVLTLCMVAMLALAGVACGDDDETTAGSGGSAGTGGNSGTGGTGGTDVDAGNMDGGDDDAG